MTTPAAEKRAACSCGFWRQGYSLEQARRIHAQARPHCTQTVRWERT